MTSGELHTLIIRVIAPMATAALDRLDDLKGEDFLRAAGHYDGVADVRARLMALADELGEQERSAVPG